MNIGSQVAWGQAIVNKLLGDGLNVKNTKVVFPPEKWQTIGLRCPTTSQHAITLHKKSINIKNL